MSAFLVPSGTVNWTLTSSELWFHVYSGADSVNQNQHYYLILILKNTMSFTDYINTTVIKIQIKYDSHMFISRHIVTIIPEWFSCIYIERGTLYKSKVPLKSLFCFFTYSFGGKILKMTRIDFDLCELPTLRSRCWMLVTLTPGYWLILRILVMWHSAVNKGFYFTWASK